MRLRRTLSPSGAPLGIADLFHALAGAVTSRRTLARVAPDIRERTGTAHLFWLSSGQAALAVVLAALHHLEGKRAVAIPAYTCFSVPAAVIRAGLEPVLVDVDPHTFDFEDGDLRRVLGRPDLLAIVPTHLFGIAADVRRITRSVARRTLFVVEDAAQAMGCRSRNGSPLGSLGDVAVFSLARGKQLTCGQGGIIATNSPRIAQACEAACAALAPAGSRRAVRNWLEMAGMTALLHPTLYWIPAGIPALRLGETFYDTSFPVTALPPTSAGALWRWRTRLDRAQDVRRRIGRAWATTLDVPLPGGPDTPYLRFPILARSRAHRDAFLQAARREGLGASAQYPTAVHRIPQLRPRFQGLSLPGAEAIADRLITLPTHRFVRDRDRAIARKIWIDVDRLSYEVTAPAAVQC